MVDHQASSRVVRPGAFAATTLCISSAVARLDTSRCRAVWAIAATALLVGTGCAREPNPSPNAGTDATTRTLLPTSSAPPQVDPRETANGLTPVTPRAQPTVTERAEPPCSLTPGAAPASEVHGAEHFVPGGEPVATPPVIVLPIGVPPDSMTIDVGLSDMNPDGYATSLSGLYRYRIQPARFEPIALASDCFISVATSAGERTVIQVCRPAVQRYRGECAIRAFNVSTGQEGPAWKLQPGVTEFAYTEPRRVVFEVAPGVFNRLDLESGETTRPPSACGPSTAHRLEGPWISWACGLASFRNTRAEDDQVVPYTWSARAPSRSNWTADTVWTVQASDKYRANGENEVDGVHEVDARTGFVRARVEFDPDWFKTLLGFRIPVSIFAFGGPGGTWFEAYDAFEKPLFGDVNVGVIGIAPGATTPTRAYLGTGRHGPRAPTPTLGWFPGDDSEGVLIRQGENNNIWRLPIR